MSRLSSNWNVYNTCLNILRKKGYELAMCPEDETTEIYECLWSAEKGEFDFLADNPIELLGLVAIYDFKEPVDDRSYWWTVGEENIVEELIDIAYPEIDHED